ncbi:uncharacterized protein LOC126659664 [Mercurialis annua]|uniref:uncharacterized protein LOC126659664 n=1 Tax=Mercurialis annua TaxID=3986 RepID=UPI002160C566|nr:uncharacterized protein LOC126659664 [Mercurialis annua]XP_050208939.1 uncharacterized protein LOC126659664 [Mercurialis annua]
MLSCYNEEEQELKNQEMKNQETLETLEIKKDEKFFTRIMSKETSMANSSCRVYYGGSSGSIPFTWESRPGTPKHSFSHHGSNIPPLTPPPSYYSNSKSRSINKEHHKPNLFYTILPKLILAKNKSCHVSHSSSMSSSSTTTTTRTTSSSSWSSFRSSPATVLSKNSKLSKNNYPCFVCSRSAMIHCGVDDDIDECEHGSRLGYGDKNKDLNGCYIMKNMKNVLLFILGHGNGSSKANF